MSIRAKRGTRAQLDAAASAGGLQAGELIYITNESRIAFATSTTAYLVVELDRLPKAGGTITGRLDLEIGDLGTNNGAANFASKNVYKVTQTGAMTLTPSNLAEGNDGQVNHTYQGGVLSFANVTRFSVDSVTTSAAFVDTDVGGTGLVVGGVYQWVFTKVGTGTLARVQRVQ
jgi:hypothetical protein